VHKGSPGFVACSFFTDFDDAYVQRVLRFIYLFIMKKQITTPSRAGWLNN